MARPERAILPVAGPRSRFGNWAARGRAWCGFPVSKAVAGLGAGLRPLDPLKKGAAKLFPSAFGSK